MTEECICFSQDGRDGGGVTGWVCEKLSGRFVGGVTWTSLKMPQFPTLRRSRVTG